MTLPRADLLHAPPVVGRFYLVPAILWAWSLRRAGPPTDPDTPGKKWWPVIGPLHNDKEFFQFEQLHYHVDLRFVSDQLMREAWPWRKGGSSGSILARPLSSTSLPDGPPAPILRKMRCARDEVPYPYAAERVIQNINEGYAGIQCAMGKRGWICPHRKVSLGSMVPDADGVITCFLHGLRIDAKTGVCLGPARKAGAS